MTINTASGSVSADLASLGTTPCPTPQPPPASSTEQRGDRRERQQRQHRQRPDHDQARGWQLSGRRPGRRCTLDCRGRRDADADAEPRANSATSCRPGIDLSGASLAGQDLHDQNGVGATLSGADLSGATLTGARLVGRRFDRRQARQCRLEQRFTGRRQPQWRRSARRQTQRSASDWRTTHRRAPRGRRPARRARAHRRSARAGHHRQLNAALISRSSHAGLRGASVRWRPRFSQTIS